MPTELWQWLHDTVPPLVVVSCRRYRRRSDDPRSDCNHRRIGSGSGPSTAWYLGVVPGPKPISKGPKVT